MTYTSQQQKYIASVDGDAHMSAIEIIGNLEAGNDLLIHINQAPDGYSWEWHCARKDEYIEQLRAEVERLRKLLGAWADSIDHALLSETYKVLRDDEVK